MAGLNSNKQRNCCKIWDEVEGALAGDRLEAIDGIDADDERAFCLEYAHTLRARLLNQLALLGNYRGG